MLPPPLANMCAHALLIKETLLWIKTPGAVDWSTRVASLCFTSQNKHCAHWTYVTRIPQQLRFDGFTSSTNSCLLPFSEIKIVFLWGKIVFNKIISEPLVIIIQRFYCICANTAAAPPSPPPSSHLIKIHSIWGVTRQRTSDGMWQLVKEMSCSPAFSSISCSSWHSSSTAR